MREVVVVDCPDLLLLLLGRVMFQVYRPVRVLSFEAGQSSFVKVWPLYGGCSPKPDQKLKWMGSYVYKTLPWPAHV